MPPGSFALCIECKQSTVTSEIVTIQPMLAREETSCYPKNKLKDLRLDECLSLRVAFSLI